MQIHGNRSGILIATDVASRGLDIPQVSQVIHYQLPASSEMWLCTRIPKAGIWFFISSYIHRSGRTARMHANGTVISSNLLEQSTQANFVIILHAVIMKGDAYRLAELLSTNEADNDSAKKLPPALKLNPNIQVGAMKIWKHAVRLEEVLICIEPVLWIRSSFVCIRPNEWDANKVTWEFCSWNENVSSYQFFFFSDTEKHV